MMDGQIITVIPHNLVDFCKSLLSRPNDFVSLISTTFCQSACLKKLIAASLKHYTKTVIFLFFRSGFGFSVEEMKRPERYV